MAERAEGRPVPILLDPSDYHPGSNYTSFIIAGYILLISVREGFFAPPPHP